MSRNKLWTWMMLAGFIGAFPTLSAALPGQGKGNPDKAKNEKNENREDHGDPKDSSGVIAVLSAGISLGYDDARGLAVENGLMGYKPLPPGIRKNLALGKPMPPGIAKTRFPASYLDRLPTHDGYEWRIAGTDLVLIFKADLSISGVLRDVFK